MPMYQYIRYQRYIYSCMLFQSPSRRWFVFGINSNRESYLEYYDSEDNMFTSPPINTISLATCRHVTRDIIIRQHAFAFSLTLSDRVLSLVAQNRSVHHRQPLAKYSN